MSDSRQLLRFAKRIVLVLVAAVLVSCDDPAAPESRCNVAALPLGGAAAAPTIVAVSLEVQPSGIVVLVTATDPQGSANLENVTQSVGVFQDRACRTTPIVIQDDLAGSGLEESFGTIVPQTSPLYSTIAASDSWPVEVDFRDSDGNRTTGRIMAEVLD